MKQAFILFMSRYEITTKLPKNFWEILYAFLKHHLDLCVYKNQNMILKQDTYTVDTDIMPNLHVDQEYVSILFLGPEHYKYKASCVSALFIIIQANAGIAHFPRRWTAPRAGSTRTRRRRQRNPRTPGLASVTCRTWSPRKSRGGWPKLARS